MHPRALFMCSFSSKLSSFFRYRRLFPMPFIIFFMTGINKVTEDFVHDRKRHAHRICTHVCGLMSVCTRALAGTLIDILLDFQPLSQYLQK